MGREHGYAVLGAGPAGLTAAYVLGLRGESATVFEAEAAVGGLARTVNFDGCRFDLGGHRFFTKLRPVAELWEDLLGADLLVRPRLSRIYYRNRYLSYPLNAREIVGRLGVAEAVLCAFSYLNARRSSGRHDTFEDWVTARFGKRLYNAFFRSYTEKVWGIPGSEIRADWASQRIRNLTLAKAILGALHLRHEPVVSLIEEFQYPRLGPGQLWEALQDRVEALGIEVRLEQPCVEVRHSGGRVESVVAGDEEHPVRGVLSSLPLGELVRRLEPDAPAEAREAAATLRYRALCVVALVTTETQPFPDNWIYLQDPGTRAGRVQNYGAWSEAMVRAQTTCLGVEYFCFEEDEIWHMPTDDAVALATRELAEIGLIDPSKVVNGTKINVPNAYPIYDRDYTDAVSTIRTYLAGFSNLQTFGRNGLHRYNNQDHSMWTAALATLNLLDDAGFDVWAVNTDDAYHELLTPSSSNGAVDRQRVAAAFRPVSARTAF